ncbi:S-layer protein domain-containing protein [uncultured Methanomethylovorans sp.]|uniref:S-layer protein domain-containing protein n=1 Tax=uncultured Methanomethylovorans sp. TaxID=183759 RepID=UPI002AA743F3|nr:S-layer protein domain-containing protein [uncultured Methanomethylovorans sp.]
MRELKKVIIGGALFCLIILCGISDAVSTNSTGNRIWDENQNLSLEYTWTPQSFSGFYYDFNTGEGSENLTVNLRNSEERTINAENMIYETRPVNSDFEYTEWGEYQAIGFMAERYFAGYSNTDFSDNISLMANEKLSKILIDSNERKSLYTGSSLILEEGYELEIREVDKDGKKVLIDLSKNGEHIDTDFVGSNSDYTYKRDLGLNDEVAIIAVHLDDIFKGTETNAVFIDGVFQISDELSSINSSDTYGKMEITSISPEKITMKNQEKIMLTKGDTVDIMGKLKLIVANNNTLRFAPMIEMSKPGNYVLRGSVAEEEFKWTPMNFEGFYYNIDEGIGTESLTVEKIDDRTIEKNKLEYKSKPEEVRFEHGEWGEFEVIGFLADKYFAGYPDNKFSDGISLVSNGELAKVLIDNEEKKRVYSGSSLLLEEGYELEVNEVNTDGSSVFLSLYKNGSMVDSDTVASNEDYAYSSNVGNIENVPLIVVHIDHIFKGTETNAVFIKGIFQVSQEYVTINIDEKYGTMKVTDFSGEGITMKNSDDISLSRDKSIEIMGNMQFRVADSNNLRYYPFIEKNTTPLESLDIDIPKTIIEGETASIEVSSRGGAVGNAVVSINQEELGITSEEGIIKYAAYKGGKFKAIASKDGFVSASKEIEVIARDDETRKIRIEISAEKVYEGDKVTLSTVKSLSGESVPGVQLLYDGKIIGNTSDEGKLEYKVKDPGIHKIKTVPDGFLPAEYNLEVIVREPKFVYSGIKIMPIDPTEEENMNLSTEITNMGTAAGEEKVELKINGSVVDTQTVALEIGESALLNFTYMSPEEGIYEAHVGTEELEFEVQKKSILPYIGIGLVIILIVFGVGYSMVKKREKMEKRVKKKGL